MRERQREGERGREREREMEVEVEGDRQTDIEEEGERGGEVERETQTDRQMDRQTDRQTDKESTYQSKVSVKGEEVSKFTGSIDLGLDNGLGLSKHCGGQQVIPTIINDWCFRPRCCTCKAILGRGQPGLMRSY